MADNHIFTIEYPDGTREVHEVKIPETGDKIEFEYTSSVDGGPIYSPKHIPAGG
tara:strand:+ start:446 stop:607 length:162 start_codon:yes stop_codon:yes gene_type:complete